MMPILTEKCFYSGGKLVVLPICPSWGDVIGNNVVVHGGSQQEWNSFRINAKVFARVRFS